MDDWIHLNEAAQRIQFQMKFNTFFLTVVSIPKDENSLWLILVDFLLMECMLSFENFLVRVLSSSVRYLSTENIWRKLLISINELWSIYSSLYNTPNVINLPMSFLRLDSLIKAAIFDIIVTALNISSLSRWSSSVHWKTRNAFSWCYKENYENWSH